MTTDAGRARLERIEARYFAVEAEAVACGLCGTRFGLACSPGVTVGHLLSQHPAVADALAEEEGR